MSPIQIISAGRNLVTLLGLLCLVNSTRANDAHATSVETKLWTLPGHHPIVVHRIGQESTISWGDTSEPRKLHGRNSREEKVKYEMDQSGVIAEVKEMGREEFKLRTPRGALIWKVKLGADKIKITGPDTNAAPIVIDGRSADGYKVRQGGKLLGTVKWSAINKNAQVMNTSGDPVFEMETGQPQISLGVLLVPGASEWERYILLAECLERAP